MRIGIDIDGVITNIDFLAGLRKNKTFLDSNVSVGNCNFPLIRKLMYHAVAFYSKNAIVRPNASKIVKQLKTDNSIFIITKRAFSQDLSKEGAKIRALTELFLLQQDIPYDLLVFAKDDKLEEIKDLGIDLMIEDSPEKSKKIAECIPVLLFSTPYNKGTSHPNITRIKNWDEIYAAVEEKSKLKSSQKTLKFGQIDNN